ncbi:hypothetical protein Dsin_016177 [Dipteronia sinensis]|uniref:RNase H type-1 domain-containing protein n=1 Tax=Dipteronia sinensis TaxID=43782 RepID=A0AAE0AD84_9ROSI|nr:hypothetical protein Dsin_016177 [Dipteronia sinensis]
MAASTQRMVANYSPQVAEAVAIYRGLRLAVESELGPIVVESDAALVVKWLNEGSFLESDVGLIFKL